MSDCILNLLPLDDAAREAFRAAAPEAEHIFAPALPYFSPVRRPEPEELRRATVILGNARRDEVALAQGLRWLQTWSSGVDEYTARGPSPRGLCSPAPPGPMTTLWPSICWP